MEGASVTDKSVRAKMPYKDPMAGIGYWASPGNSPKQKRKATDNGNAVPLINIEELLVTLQRNNTREDRRSAGL